MRESTCFSDGDGDHSLRVKLPVTKVIHIDKLWSSLYT